MLIRILVTSMALSLISLAATSATITDTGDVLISGADVLVGNSLYGKREVFTDDNDLIQYNSVSLGNTTGVLGEFTVRHNGRFDFLGTVLVDNMIIGSQGEGYSNVEFGVLSSPNLVIGLNIGSDGTLFQDNNGIVRSEGVGSAVTVGDAGTGVWRIGSFAGPVQNAYIENLLIGKQVTGTGFINILEGYIDIGDISTTGNLVVGDAGTGEISVGSRSGIKVEGPDSTVTIGKLAGSNGVVGLSASSISISGSNSTATIGEYGNGEVNIYEGGFSGADQMFIGRYPGSSGSLALSGPSGSSATIIRVGLDENDNPGGSGSLSVGYDSALYGDLLKIGANSYADFRAPSGVPTRIESSGRIINVDGYTFTTLINSGLMQAGSQYDAAIGQPYMSFTDQYVQENTGVWQIGFETYVYTDEYLSLGTLRGQAGSSASLDGTIELVFPPNDLPSVYSSFRLVTADTIILQPGLSVTSSGLPADLQISTELVVLTNGQQEYQLTIVRTDGPTSDFAVSHSGPSPATAATNSDFTFQVVVSNNGPDTGQYTLTNILPTETTFVSANDASCMHASGTVVCSGSLAALQSKLIDITVRAPSSSMTLSNTVSISTSNTDPDTSNNTSTHLLDIIAPIADLTLSMSDNPDPAKRSKPFTYSIVVVNNGPDTATNINVADTLPANINVLSLQSSNATCSGITTVTCSIASLIAGEAAFIDIEVMADYGGTYENTVSVIAPLIEDPNLSNNTAVETTVVRGRKSR